MADSSPLCQKCKVEPVAYRQLPSGKPLRIGLCQACYVRAVKEDGSDDAESRSEWEEMDQEDESPAGSRESADVESLVDHLAEDQI